MSPIRTSQPETVYSISATVQTSAHPATPTRPVVRARLGFGGCYILFNAAGHFLARTIPAAESTTPPARLKLAAVRMAYANELATLCRLSSIDFEATGAVSPTTMGLIRDLLTEIEVA